jgi:hypothetical protein
MSRTAGIYEKSFFLQIRKNDPSRVYRHALLRLPISPSRQVSAMLATVNAQKKGKAGRAGFSRRFAK